MRGVILVVLCLALATTSFSVNVTYDHRAVVIDGKRRLLVSGSIHYPRSTPKMWPDLIQKSKEGGLHVIETYVFWNIHEPTRGQYDFSGNKDLVRFVKTVAEAGLYVHLRIGPYVCAEWNYGGFPLWLHMIPGIELRTDNELYKAEMQRFTAKIVGMMKEAKLYASQGGPIILSQIENEYGNIMGPYGAAGKSYVKWSAEMALSMNTGVPWVMCQQDDAPDPIISTCNGFYCDNWYPKSKKTPKMWTENWTGWFLGFGGAVPYRPVEDIAFAVARFYQRGGTFQNYYMYHGGTNFGRTSGGPFISTSYDYDAPLDEYGIPNRVKWGHLKELHKALALVEEAVVATDPIITTPGPNLETAVYESGSGCVAFLANLGDKVGANVAFNGSSYNVPAWSVSILPDCKNVVFNTAKINSASMIPSFKREAMIRDVGSKTAKSGWSWINEPVGISKDDAFTRPGLLEQINTTADKSDYLWYSISIDVKGNEPYLVRYQSLLYVESLGHAIHAFVNGKVKGSKTGSGGNPKVSLEIPISLVNGKNTIDLLSLTVGLQNYGSFFDKVGAGITGPVELRSVNGDAVLDLSSANWTYQIGLKGEESNLPSGDSSLWISNANLPKKKPLTWYKTAFEAPSGSSPVALDFRGMGKGEAWVNGQSIGRYWPTYMANSTCTKTTTCNYRGQFNDKKCRKNCGKPSQQLYHVPREWLRPSENTLVLFEEAGGDPTRLSFSVRNDEVLCAQVSESQPAPVDMWKSGNKSTAVMRLECPCPEKTISSIRFASFGTPHGSCGRFRYSKCNSARALDIVEKACVGSNSCSIEVSVEKFGDPCVRRAKSLAVEAYCI